MSEGKLIKIRITDGAKRIIERTADELDMKEIGVASRVLEWFGRADAATRSAVLGFHIEIEGDETTAIVLKRIASGKSKGR